MFKKENKKKILQNLNVIYSTWKCEIVAEISGRIAEVDARDLLSRATLQYVGGRIWPSTSSFTPMCLTPFLNQKLARKMWGFTRIT